MLTVSAASAAQQIRDLTMEVPLLNSVLPGTCLGAYNQDGAPCGVGSDSSARGDSGAGFRARIAPASQAAGRWRQTSDAGPQPAQKQPRVQRHEAARSR